jgi:hypothetical protein
MFSSKVPSSALAVCRLWVEPKKAMLAQFDGEYHTPILSIEFTTAFTEAKP